MKTVKKIAKRIAKKSATKTMRAASKKTPVTQASKPAIERAPGVCACGCKEKCESKAARLKASRGEPVWALGHDHRALTSLAKEFGGTFELISFVRSIQAKKTAKDASTFAAGHAPVATTAKKVAS